MEERIKLRKIKRDILNDLEFGSTHLAQKKISQLPKNKKYLKDFLNSIQIERISGVGSREQSTSRFKQIKWPKSNKKTSKKTRKKTRKKKKRKTNKRRQ